MIGAWRIFARHRRGARSAESLNRRVGVCVFALVCVPTLGLAANAPVSSAATGSAAPAREQQPLWLACQVEGREPTSSEKALIYRHVNASLNIASRYLGDPARLRVQVRARFSLNFLARLDAARRVRLKAHRPVAGAAPEFKGGGFACDRGVDGRRFYYLGLEILFRFGHDNESPFFHTRCRLTPTANWYVRFWTIE